MRKISKLKLVSLSFLLVSTMPVHASPRSLGKRVATVALGVGVIGVASQYSIASLYFYKKMEPKQEQATRAYILKICPNFSDSLIFHRRWTTSKTIDLREIELNPLRKMYFQGFDLIGDLEGKACLSGEKNTIKERLWTWQLAQKINESEEKIRELRKTIAQSHVGKKAGSIEQIKLDLEGLELSMVHAARFDKLRVDRKCLQSLLEDMEQGKVDMEQFMFNIETMEDVIDAFTDRIKGKTDVQFGIIGLQPDVQVGSPRDRSTGGDRFTVAHELGHYCSHGLTSVLLYTQEKIEVEADFEAMKMLDKYDSECLRLNSFYWVKNTCANAHQSDPYLRMNEKPLFLYWWRQEKDKPGFNSDKFLAQYINNRELVKKTIKKEDFLGNYKVVDGKLCRSSLSGDSLIFEDEEGFESCLESDALKVINQIEQAINIETIE